MDVGWMAGVCMRFQFLTTMIVNKLWCCVFWQMDTNGLEESASSIFYGMELVTYPSILKMEGIVSFDTFVYIYQAVHCNITNKKQH